ncbi:MAG: FAD-dependent oxidoreductase [Janthinobacterium lividum]
MKSSLLTRRHFVQVAPKAALIPLLARSMAWAAVPGSKLQVDVCIYGGVSGGVIAAIALARLGRSVALIESTRHLGGMATGGLGWIDVKIGGWRAYGGLTGEYYRRVREYYAGKGIEVSKFGNDGAVAEPHVAEAIFEQMLSEHAKHLTVFRESRLASLQKEGRRIRTVVLDKALVDGRGAPAPTPTERSYVSISASMFIDASYEGDLLAAAGISHRGDRESRDEYGEKRAGILFSEKKNALDPYVKPGQASSGLLPLVSSLPLGTESASSPFIQAYCFRLCLVKDNPIPIQPEANYSPKTYEILARMIAAESVNGDPYRADQMHKPGSGRLLKFSHLPNGKTDVNNAAPVSMDFVTGGAERYAKASWAERTKLWHAHEDYQRGLYFFLQTDPRVPEDIRVELARWGLPRDEFKDTQGWPTQLYIREARRMVGAYVMQESDCYGAPANLPDAVAIGTYSLDSHECQRLVVQGKVMSEGGFYDGLPAAYPISYRTLTPRAEECENLLVTFCVSATHVCFASVRMEPPFMVLSESAALAVHSALEENTSVQGINAERFRKRLRNAGQIVSPADIPND